MSETFLTRWARRKRAAADAAHAGAPAESPAESKNDAAPVAAPAPDQAADSAGESAFDPSKLPPLDSITSASDVRAFLAPGVPAQLTRAALRRAWSADPAIRDFVGIAENQWDFTTPGGAPGFGPLEASEELRRLVARIVGDEPAEVAPPVPAPTAENPEDADVTAAARNAARTAEEENAAAGCVAPAAKEAETDIVQNSNIDDASQHKSPRDLTERRAGHGSALPR